MTSDDIIYIFDPLLFLLLIWIEWNMKNLQKTKFYGGNYKNILVLEFPCGEPGVNIFHVRGPNGAPPTLEDVANALSEHAGDCQFCNSEQ